jgi:hypothetical protein
MGDINYGLISSTGAPRVPGQQHIDGPASTGGRVESSAPSRRQTVTGPAVGITGVGASTPNVKKKRAQAATFYANEQQPIDK